VEWINEAQDRNQRRVLELSDSKNGGEFLA
jgi:hypothetical protein